MIFFLALGSRRSRYSLDHGLTIVSRDAGEFQQARGPVVNPWGIE